MENKPALATMRQVKPVVNKRSGGFSDVTVIGYPFSRGQHDM